MNQKFHVTKNASEWLFDGYEDQMINLAKDNPFLNAGDIPFDRFGWFYMVKLKLNGRKITLQVHVIFDCREMIAALYSVILIQTQGSMTLVK